MTGEKEILRFYIGDSEECKILDKYIKRTKE